MTEYQSTSKLLRGAGSSRQARSIRFEEAIDAAMVESAAQLRVSINTFVNDAVAAYIATTPVQVYSSTSNAIGTSNIASFTSSYNDTISKLGGTE